MRSLVLFSVLLTQAMPALHAQSKTPPPGTVELKPDSVLATINGRKFTLAELERLLKVLNPQAQAQFAAKPAEFLRQMAETEAFAKEAEKASLDQNSPLREQLAITRREILARAALNHQVETAQVTTEDARKFYEDNLETFREVRVRVLFVSRATVEQRLVDGKTVGGRDAETSKLQIQTALKQIRDGRDFGQTAREFSDDRDTAEKDGVLATPIRANDDKMPLEFRAPLMKAKPGDLVGPIEHASGWYLFKVESVTTPSFPEAQPGIVARLKQAAAQRWADGIRSKTSVTLDDQSFWDQFVESNKKPEPSTPSEGSSK